MMEKGAISALFTNFKIFSDQAQYLQFRKSLNSLFFSVVFSPDSKIDLETLHYGMRSLISYAKSNNREKFLPYFNLYDDIIDALKTLEKGNTEKALKLIKKRLDAIPPEKLKLERFCFTTLLAIITMGNGFEREGKILGYEAIKIGMDTQPEDFNQLQIVPQMKYLLELIMPSLDKVKNVEVKSYLLKVKLFFTPESDPARVEVKNDISGILKDQINHLLDARNFDEVMRKIQQSKLPLDNFIPALEAILNSTKNCTPITLGNFLMWLLAQNFEEISQKLPSSFRSTIFTQVVSLVIKNPRLLLQMEHINLILEYILKDTHLIQDFLNELAQLTEDLVRNPADKSSMALFLKLNEIFANQGFKVEAQTIHSWIQATLEIRRVIKSEQQFAEAAYKILKETDGSYAPAALISKYYELLIINDKRMSMLEKMNKMTVFLARVSELCYNFRLSAARIKSIDLIQKFGKNIAEFYANHIQSQMRSLDIIRIFSEGMKYVFPMTVGGINPSNPSIFASAINRLLILWDRLPKLERTIYYNPYLKIVSYTPPNSQSNQWMRRPLSVGVDLWFQLFNEILIFLFQGTNQELAKSEALKHQNLLEIVRATLRFYHCVREHLRYRPLPGDKLPDSTLIVKYLKMMDDQAKFSDDELRELILTSPWGQQGDYETKLLLSQIIERKNFCVYCNFNMPPGAKVCPNCNKTVQKFLEPKLNLQEKAAQAFFATSHDQTPSSKEEPQVDLAAMQQFFDSPTPEPAPEPVPEPVPAPSPEPAPAPEPQSGGGLGDIDQSDFPSNDETNPQIPVPPETAPAMITDKPAETKPNSPPETVSASPPSNTEAPAEPINVQELPPIDYSRHSTLGSTPESGASSVSGNDTSRLLNLLRTGQSPEEKDEIMPKTCPVCGKHNLQSTRVCTNCNFPLD